MPIDTSSGPIQALYIGDTLAQRAYVGTVQVWPDTSLPVPMLAVGFNEGVGDMFAPTIGPGQGVVTLGYGQWVPGPQGGMALGRYATGPSSYDDPCALLTGLSSLNTASWTGMTIMAWVNLHDNAHERWPLLLMSSSSTDDAWMGWRMTQNTDKPMSYFNGVSVQSSDDVAPANTWCHFCTTWDGAAQQFYVDGVLVASTVVAGPLYSTTTIAIGSSIHNYGAQGVDDLRIYDQSLSQQQIATLMGVAVS